MRMRAVATRLSDGREVPLEHAAQLQVTASLSTPARSMSGSFVVARPPGKLGAVRVYGEGGLLFDGSVDRQQVALSQKGMLLEVEARSKGALLLDNEALPCALANVHLGAVFSRFIAPYGFVCYNPNPSRTLSIYTVRGGSSEWEALCGFTRRAWGITPYVDGDMVCVASPGSGSALTISNSGGGTAFSKLEQAYIPYKMISQVILRDEWGNYSAAVSNASAPYHGVRRKRYVIPSTEFVDSPALDANQRIRRSMLESEQVVATLPGLVPAKIGQPVQVLDKAFMLYNLLVRELMWQQDSDGVVTRLWLASSVYY